MSQPYLALILGVVGLCAGAVIAYTGPLLMAARSESLADRPSPWLLVPVVGALRSRPFRYLPIVFELLLGALLACLALHFGESRTLVISSVFTVLLALIAYIDLQHRLVLNVLSLPGTLAAIALSSFWPGVGPGSAALGALAGLVVFACLQLLGRGALGSGDTKLAMLIGAMKGVPGVLSALVLGVLLGGLAAIFLMIALRRGRKEYFAYGPYLAAGAVLSFFVS